MSKFIIAIIVSMSFMVSSVQAASYCTNIGAMASLALEAKRNGKTFEETTTALRGYFNDRTVNDPAVEETVKSYIIMTSVIYASDTTNETLKGIAADASAECVRMVGN